MNDFGRFTTGESEEEYALDRKEEEQKTRASELKDDICNANYQTYKNYSFVIKCMKEAKEKNFSYIDCFGIIDYDSGQHTEEIKEIDNIEQSKCHDRETTLLSCGILSYINSINDSNDKTAVKEKIMKTLLFAVKQGIMEKASFEYEDDYGETTVLRKMTNNYISSRVSKRDWSLFSYSNYINMFLTAPRQPQLNYLNDYNQIKENFENKYLIRIINLISGVDATPSLHDAEINLDNYLTKEINKWFNSSNDENDAIDEIFKYTNGHFFLTQLLYGNNQTNLFKDECGNIIEINNDAEKKLLKILFNQNEKKNINALFKRSPLKEYNKYRLTLKEKEKISIEKER